MSVYKKYCFIPILLFSITICSASCQFSSSSSVVVGNPIRTAASITEAEAIAVIKQAEDYAKAGDIQSLCAMNGNIRSDCERNIKELGGLASVPRVSPTVTRQYIIPDRPNLVGGRLLIVEGPDNFGGTYQTSVLIFDIGGGKLVPFEPVYWSSMGYGMSIAPGAASSSPGPLPPPVSTTPISITP
jgi:hypothetical protein